MRCRHTAREGRSGGGGDEAGDRARGGDARGGGSRARAPRGGRSTYRATRASAGGEISRRTPRRGARSRRTSLSVRSGDERRRAQFCQHPTATPRRKRTHVAAIVPWRFLMRSRPCGGNWCIGRDRPSVTRQTDEILSHWYSFRHFAIPRTSARLPARRTRGESNALSDSRPPASPERARASLPPSSLVRYSLLHRSRQMTLSVSSGPYPAASLCSWKSRTTAEACLACNSFTLLLGRFLSPLAFRSEWARRTRTSAAPPWDTTCTLVPRR